MPNKILEGFVPTIIKILNAIRLCKFQRSIAAAIIKPPINKNKIGSMYCAAVSLISMIPKDGKKINGRMEVIAMCTTSVNHHSATQHTSPSMVIISGCEASNDGALLIKINNNGPAIKSKLRFKLG